MALVVLAAAVWQGIIALQPAKHKTPVDKATSPHGMEVTAVRQSPMRDSPSPSPVVSPNVATPLSNQETPSSSPQPTATDPPGRGRRSRRTPHPGGRPAHPAEPLRRARRHRRLLCRSPGADAGVRRNAGGMRGVNHPSSSPVWPRPKVRGFCRGAG